MSAGHPARGTEPGPEVPWTLAEPARKGKHFGEVYKTVCGNATSREGPWPARGHPAHPDQVPGPSQHQGPDWGQVSCHLVGGPRENGRVAGHSRRRHWQPPGPREGRMPPEVAHTAPAWPGPQLCLWSEWKAEVLTGPDSVRCPQGGHGEASAAPPRHLFSSWHPELVEGCRGGEQEC